MADEAEVLAIVAAAAAAAATDMGAPVAGLRNGVEPSPNDGIGCPEPPPLPNIRLGDPGPVTNDPKTLGNENALLLFELGMLRFPN